MPTPRPVIVSMTTISSRTAHLEAVLRSILSGSYRPDRLLLHISAEPCGLDDGLRETDLPAGVRALADAGRIEIVTVENTGSYRKLLPALDRVDDGDGCIVTADDDVAYPREWLRGLVEAAALHGGIVAYRSRRIVRRGGTLQPYNLWPFADADTDGMPVLPTGRGGILYRRRFFPDMALLQTLMPLAPHQDDIAFRFASLMAGIPVRTLGFVRSGSDKPEFDGFSYPASLYRKNVLEHGAVNANDAAIRRIVSLLGGERVAGLLDGAGRDPGLPTGAGPPLAG